MDGNGDGDYADAVDRVIRTIWDGENPYAEFNGNNALQHRFLYGNAVDQLFARIDAAGNPEWLLTDHLGSVRQVVDKNGNVLANANYDSFGRILTPEDPDLGNMRYTARFFEITFGLQYNRARWYDADIGRWISEDSEGFRSGDGNFYRYVYNAPTIYVDPSGHSAAFAAELEYNQRVLAIGAWIVETAFWLWATYNAQIIAVGIGLGVIILEASREGGAFRDLPQDARPRHHVVPRKSLEEVNFNPNSGPSIKMDPGDHQKTISWGNSDVAKLFRKQIVDLLEHYST